MFLTKLIVTTMTLATSAVSVPTNQKANNTTHPTELSTLLSKTTFSTSFKSKVVYVQDKYQDEYYVSTRKRRSIIGAVMYLVAVYSTAVAVDQMLTNVENHCVKQNIVSKCAKAVITGLADIGISVAGTASLTTAISTARNVVNIKNVLTFLKDLLGLRRYFKKS